MSRDSREPQRSGGREEERLAHLEIEVNNGEIVVGSVFHSLTHYCHKNMISLAYIREKSSDSSSPTSF